MVYEEEEVDQNNFGQHFSHHALHFELGQRDEELDKGRGTPEAGVRSFTPVDQEDYRHRNGYGAVQSRKLWLVRCWVRSLCTLLACFPPESIHCSPNENSKSWSTLLG